MDDLYRRLYEIGDEHQQLLYLAVLSGIDVDSEDGYFPLFVLSDATHKLKEFIEDQLMYKVQDSLIRRNLKSNNEFVSWILGNAKFMAYMINPVEVVNSFYAEKETAQYMPNLVLLNGMTEDDREY